MTEISLTLDDVERAAARLDGVASMTPELTSTALEEQTGAAVRCKGEFAQRTGSFKFRGAYNAVTALEPEVRRRGIATFSSGNHGQAIARSAALHGVPAVVVMPDDAPAAKRAGVLDAGAEIVSYDRYAESREDIARSLADDRGFTVIPPFDDWNVMAGQGTVAHEMFAVEPLDVIVVCVGGGGLISGCSTVAKAHGDCRVVGVEPAAGDDVKQSLERGEIVALDEVPRTIADGQQTTAPSDKTFAVIRERVDEVVLATDDEVVAAMRFAEAMWGVTLEPSGACALAAVVAGRIEVAGQRVGVTLSGGNVDPARFRALVG